MAKSDIEEIINPSTTTAKKAARKTVEFQGVLNDKDDKTIHSGHFMLSNLDDNDEVENGEAAANNTIKEGAKITYSKTKEIGRKSSNLLAIDTSLAKVFECMSLAYSGKLPSPKWKDFRGIKLRVYDKVRLNNIIWREWHMQFIHGKKPVICQFDPPISDKTHTKPEAIVLEGKYWKRRLESLTAEYKKWRMFYKDLLTTGSLSSDKELLQELESQVSKKELDSTDFNDEDFFMDFNDTFFTSINQPVAFPTSRELYQLGPYVNFGDIIQPGLLQLQPNLDEMMDTLDPLEPLPSLHDMMMYNTNMNMSISSYLGSSSLQQNLSLQPTVNGDVDDGESSLRTDMIDQYISATGGAPLSDSSNDCRLLSQSADNERMHTPDVRRVEERSPPDSSLINDFCDSLSPQTPLDCSGGQGRTLVLNEPTTQMMNVYLTTANNSRMQSTNQGTAHGIQPITIVQTPSQLQSLLQFKNQFSVGGNTSQGVNNVQYVKSRHTSGNAGDSVSQLASLLVSKQSSVDSLPLTMVNRRGSTGSVGRGGPNGPANCERGTTGQEKERASYPTTVTQRPSNKKDGSFVVPQPMDIPVKQNKLRSFHSANDNTKSTGHNVASLVRTSSDANSSILLAKLLSQSQSQGGSCPLPGGARSSADTAPIKVERKSSSGPTLQTIRPAPSTIATVSISNVNSVPTYSQHHDMNDYHLITSSDQNIIVGPDFQSTFNISDVMNRSEIITLSDIINMRSTPGVEVNQRSSPLFQSTSPVDSESGVRSRHTSTESVTQTIDSEAQSRKRKNNGEGEGFGQHKEQRRALHLSAEQKRRGNIKVGFDALHQLLPSLNQNRSVKVSKATALQKAGEYIKVLKQEKMQMHEEVNALKRQMETLNNAISECQSQLPATGVSVARQRVDHMREMFDDYVRRETFKNWKFWIFSNIIRSLFESFNNNVSTASVDAVWSTVLAWHDKYCSLVELRPAVMRSLIQICNSTSMLSDPSKVPSQALRAVVTKSFLSSANHHQS